MTNARFPWADVLQRSVTDARTLGLRTKEQAEDLVEALEQASHSLWTGSVPPALRNWTRACVEGLAGPGAQASPVSIIASQPWPACSAVSRVHVLLGALINGFRTKTFRSRHEGDYGPAPATACRPPAPYALR